MKRILLTLSLLLFGCGGPSTSAPTDDFTIKYTGRKCLESRLRDPDSLHIISERVVRPGSNNCRFGYHAKYRAKNGFGGYVVETFYVNVE